MLTAERPQPLRGLEGWRREKHSTHSGAREAITTLQLPGKSAFYYQIRTW